MSTYDPRISLWLSVAVVLGAAAAALPIHAQDSTISPIHVQTMDTTVVATGLTPGGAAAIVTSWRIGIGGQFLQSRSWRDARADQNGAVSAEFTHSIPASALVAVVDVAAGRMHVSTADGREYPRIELPQQWFRKDAAGDVENLVSPQDDVLVIVLRPGDGAWLQIAKDGGSGDSDGKPDGRILSSPETMKPIAYSGAAPKKIKHRDLVVAVNIDRAAYASAEVGQ